MTLTTETEFKEAFHDQAEQDFVEYVFGNLDVFVPPGDHLVTSSDRTIEINASRTAITITIPAIPDTTQKLNIACSDSTFAAEIDLNGNAFYTVTENLALYAGQNITMQWTGSKWIGA